MILVDPSQIYSTLLKPTDSSEKDRKEPPQSTRVRVCLCGGIRQYYVKIVSVYLEDLFSLIEKSSKGESFSKNWKISCGTRHVYDRISYFDKADASLCHSYGS